MVATAAAVEHGDTLPGVEVADLWRNAAAARVGRAVAGHRRDGVVCASAMS
jgi:hypothetical protein